MELFYNKDINKKTAEFQLDGIENNHIIKVLRKKEGDIITFTNGKNLKFKVKIIKLSKKSSFFKILSSEIIESNKHLHVAISILKSTSRFEIFLEKAVEIGISEITPIICERTLKKNVKIDRCNKIIISAIKHPLKHKV
jgi:16S rRNA (uracil1498-N3)-methyltransferase